MLQKFLLLLCLTASVASAHNARRLLAYDKANLQSDLQALNINFGDVSCAEVTGTPSRPGSDGRGVLNCQQFYDAVAKIPQIKQQGLTEGCPPPGFDALKDFSPEAYVSRPWFIVEQTSNSYQPANELYCVRAKYTPKNPNNITEGVWVQNYEVVGGVNGTPTGTSGIGNAPLLAARIYNVSQPSKLAVGPAFPGFSLPPNAFGPYWVVAAGNSKNLSASDPGFPGYDWAIVTGGPPVTKSESGKGCRTGSPLPEVAAIQTNRIGFWLFLRDPLPDPALIQEMRKVAEGLGLDTSQLVRVQHEGCTYAGADVPLPASASQAIIA